MKMLLSLSAAALVGLSTASADLVYGNLGPTGTDSFDNFAYVIGTSSLGQAFQTPVTGGLLSLDSIVLPLSVTSGTSGATLRIYANNAGVPTGSPLETLSGSVSSSTPVLTTFSFSTPLTLANNSIYWIVASDPDGGQAYNWHVTSPLTDPSGQNSSGYTFVTAKTSPDMTVWSANPLASKTALSVNASNPIPEPATWAAAATLLGGAGLTTLRRRRASE